MRQDYAKRGGYLFILSVIIFILWYFFDPTVTLLVVSFFVFLGAIYYLIKAATARPQAQTPQPYYQPAPTPTYRPPPSAEPNAPICPTCGQPLTYLPDIQKWYCTNEKKIVTPITPTQPVPSAGQNVAQQLAAERAELHKELHMLDERLVEGKISEATYKDLKAKYEARLKEIE